MTVLTVDGESALNSEEAAVALERSGTSRKLKAPGQRAQIVERHHDILRRQMHLIDSQCFEEGLTTPLQRRLAEAVFAKSAFLTVGNGTPYKALYGRVPLLLRDFDRSGAQTIDDEEGGGESGLQRHVQRLREMAITSVVQATGQDRIQRAAKARTVPTIEDLLLEPGDLVYIYIYMYRKPTSKDLPGWRGPATVVSAASPETGRVTVKWQGHELAVRRAELRRAILYASFIVYRNQHESSPLRTITEFVEQPNGQLLHLGWTYTTTGWHLTSASTQYHTILAALMNIASCGLHLTSCIAARLGQRVPNLPGLHTFEQATLCWWLRPSGKDKRNTNDAEYLEYAASEHVSLRRLFGEDWDRICFIQFLTVDDDAVQQARQQMPWLPHVGGPSIPGIDQWRARP